MYSVSVAGVVTNESGQVLLQRRADNGEWQIPGGVLERDESTMAGLTREICEETGIRVTVERLSGVYRHTKRNIVAMVFKCYSMDTKVSLSSESTDVGWFDPQAAMDVVPVVFKERISDALSGEPPIVREHDGSAWLSPGSCSST